MPMLGVCFSGKPDWIDWIGIVFYSTREPSARISLPRALPESGLSGVSPARDPSMASGGTPMRQRHRQGGGSGIGFGGTGGGSFDLEDGGLGGYLDDDEDKVKEWGCPQKSNRFVRRVAEIPSIGQLRIQDSCRFGSRTYGVTRKGCSIALRSAVSNVAVDLILTDGGNRMAAGVPPLPQPHFFFLKRARQSRETTSSLC